MPWTQWAVWMVLVGTVAAAGGCEYAMPMPPEALRIVPLPSGQSGPEFLREVQQLKIPGDVSYWRIHGSEDGTVVAAEATIREWPDPCENATSRRVFGLWDVSTGQLIRQIEQTPPAEDPFSVRVNDISPNGRWLSIGDAQGIEIQDVWSGAVVRRIPHSFDGRVASPGTFDADGRRVRTRSHLTGRDIWVDIETGAESDAGLLVHPIGECGDAAVIGPYGPQVVVDRWTGRQVELQARRGGVARTAAFSEDCGLVAAGFDRTLHYFLSVSRDMTPSLLRVWDAATGELLAWYISHPDAGSTHEPIAFIPGTDALLVRAEGSIRLLDLRQRRELARIWVSGSGEGEVRAVADGRLLLVQHNGGVSVYRVELPGSAVGGSHQPRDGDESLGGEG